MFVFFFSDIVDSTLSRYRKVPLKKSSSLPKNTDENYPTFSSSEGEWRANESIERKVNCIQRSPIFLVLSIVSGVNFVDFHSCSQTSVLPVKKDHIKKISSHLFEEIR